MNSSTKIITDATDFYCYTLPILRPDWILSLGWYYNHLKDIDKTQRESWASHELYTTFPPCIHVIGNCPNKKIMSLPTFGPPMIDTCDSCLIKLIYGSKVRVFGNQNWFFIPMDKFIFPLKVFIYAKNMINVKIISLKTHLVWYDSVTS